MRYARAGDPDAIDAIKGSVTLGHLDRGQDGQVSFGRTLIVTQFGQPARVKRPSALCLPQDNAALLARAIVDVLQDIAAVVAHRDRLDGVHRKLTAKNLFELQFHGFALHLGNTLLGFPL